MPRPLVIGNGRLLINFDDGLNMRDLYYPHVGMLNHICGHVNGLGIWVEGIFSWIDGPSWERGLDYEPETLVTRAEARDAGLGITLQITDAVHYRDDLYLKQVQVVNEADRPRDIHIFLNHDICIDETDIGDTALYDIATDAILHYKRDRSLLISGYAAAGTGGNPGDPQGIHQYATGTKRFGGAEGTWRDAEDGYLEGNPIAQGSVDSTVGFLLSLAAGETGVICYWIAVGTSFAEVRQLHQSVHQQGFDQLLAETRTYWRSWVNKQDRDFGDLPESVVRLFKRSLLLVRTQIDRNGAVVAANDSDILHFNRDHYSYVWPRDGALVALAMDKAGYPEMTRAFFEFCEGALAPGGYLWHKYNPDGTVGSSWHPWTRDGHTQLPIQEDETALVILALWNYFEQDRDLDFAARLYATLVKPAAEFMVAYRHPDTQLPLDTHDLWEERRGVFTFTVAAVFGGLRAAQCFAELLGDGAGAGRYGMAAEEVREAIDHHLYDQDLGRFVRGFVMKPGGELVLDATLESSLAGLFMFGAVSADDPRMTATMEALHAGLWVDGPVGGIARYTRDFYFHRTDDFHRVPGNPWMICTLWVAQWYIARARTRDDLQPARDLLDWVVRNAFPSGVLPEQLHPESGQPLSVAPLTWSHATFVHTVLDYLDRRYWMEQRESSAAVGHPSPI